VVHVVDAGRCKSRSHLASALLAPHSQINCTVAIFVMLPLPLPSNTVFPHSGFASGDVAFDTLSVQWVTQASAVTTMLL
jgi:hypothetical protein